jgi:hypothetical protein
MKVTETELLPFLQEVVKETACARLTLAGQSSPGCSLERLRGVVGVSQLNAGANHQLFV